MQLDRATIGLVLEWPLPTLLTAKSGLSAGQPILAVPFAAGVGTYWWMNGGFMPTDLFKFGKAYLLAGVVAAGMFYVSLEAEAAVLKQHMGDKQSRSATR